MSISLTKREFFYLAFLYFSGLFLRLYPRFTLHPHLLTFEADIWYRLCLAQYLLDHGSLPEWDIRYEAYGQVPFWYNPLAVYFLAFLSKLFSLDLPTIASRVMPFVEATTILPMYFLCRYLFNRTVAVIATLFLQLSPSFIFWSGICTLQSFTLFLIPVMIMLWIKFLKNEFLFKNQWTHLTFMGILLAINFLIHLSVFNLIIILILVHLALILESQTQPKKFLYLLFPIGLSQILTMGWWLPHNLYWWWTQVLTTSSAFWEGLTFLKHYGFLSAILGHLSLIFLLLYILKHNKAFPTFYLIPVLWALFPMIESHNEGILKLINRQDLTWVNIVKPLEGFRFYCFLTQPLAVCFALMIHQLMQSNFFKHLKPKKVTAAAFLIILCSLLLGDMLKNYNLFGRFRNPQMQIEEIKAAWWFRENSKPTDRILTEYFTAQMFGGICGGKSLMGSMFPLKNVKIPYISEGWKVQKDIYSVFTTADPLEIEEILQRYKCTHVFLSKKALRHIELISKGDSVLEDIEGLEDKDFSLTLLNPQYFQSVYEDKDSKILKWIGS